MIEFGPLNLTDVLIAVLSFFLVDLVRQIKALNSAMAALKETVAVEIALRNGLKSDIDAAHQSIRELQEDVADIRVNIAACPKKGN
jgi:hypothetical protein